MKTTGRLLLALMLVSALAGCAGTRTVATGAKATGRGVLTVLEYPSKVLAGHPPDYAAMQGMTEADKAETAAVVAPAVKHKAPSKVKRSRY